MVDGHPLGSREHIGQLSRPPALGVNEERAAVAGHFVTNPHAVRSAVTSISIFMRGSASPS